MMEILKRNLHRVAFFRPIIFSKDTIDNDIKFMLKRYKLDMKYEECYGFDVEYVESMIAQDRFNELLNQLIVKFKKLEEQYDFVLCEGIRRSFFNSNMNYNINIEIAKNFGSPCINVLNASQKNAHDIYESLIIENEQNAKRGCVHFATFINRVDLNERDALHELLKSTNYTTYVLEEVEELHLPTIEDVIGGLGAKKVMVAEHDYSRVVRNIKVAALTLDNFLDHIEEDDLVIVPADRSDIILGLLGALHSRAYANISAIVFPLNMKIHKNINRLILGLNGFSVPILSVAEDTFKTANNIANLHSRLHAGADRKIALALGLFNANVDVKSIEEKIETTYSDIMTPQMFEYKLFNIARENKQKIVLPESDDERVLRAAEIILRLDVAEIVLLGDKEELRERYLRLGINLDKAEIINHRSSELMELFVETFYEMRKEKGLSRKAAQDTMVHANYFATMMVELGYADGMVSGAMHTTGDTIRPALQIIKTQEGVKVVSSIFFMCMETKVLIYGDCAINQDPDALTLADIAIASAKTSRAFGITPKVAMLSYSTGESGKGIDVDKVREATKIVQAKEPDLLIDGPMQYDAAVNKAVAKSKLPHSKVAGDATVFIFPDLNTGNNTYKAVQRSSGAIAIGPILQGLKKPINDLSRGCLVADIVNTVAITAIQAIQSGKK
jgi:phosphate acetyltransferase